MNNVVDFKWLEEKTSPEMVTAVRKIVEGQSERQILNIQQKERIVEDCKIHNIDLYITTDLSCHYFTYNVRRDYFLHDSMSRFVINEFAEMEKERIDQLTSEAQ